MTRIASTDSNLSILCFVIIITYPLFFIRNTLQATIKQQLIPG